MSVELPEPARGTFEHRIPTPTRVASYGLDRILGSTYRVLDAGFVRAVDYMGGDASIVQAARVSYGAGTKNVHEDEGLIRYLMRQRHTTPFEMCELKLHVKVPMDAWRQWIRHRTASVNERSTRYSEALDDKAKTDSKAWRAQSGQNKQGSAAAFVTAWPLGELPASASTPGEYLSRQEATLHAQGDAVYQERLAFGVAREQARKDLPLSNYTEAYWKIDLHNLFHFLSLRLDSHAQLEIRSYAQVIAFLVKAWVPMAWKAFEDFRLNAMFLTATDITMMNALNCCRGVNCAVEFGWLDAETGEVQKSRERTEFEAKAKSLGISIPWLNV